MLKFSVLASGSSGNAVYIESNETKLLLDAGISGKQLQLRLQSSAGKSLADLNAVLVTHEHIDHVRGLKQAVKQSNAPVYITEGTWAQIEAQVSDTVVGVNRVIADQSFTIGDITVTPFAVSHDAEEPVAYRFDTDQDSLAVVTDLGYVSDHIKSVIQNCKAYVWEANHDVEMLRAGRYPWSVKRRILGDKGHLSNYDCAVALADILGNDCTEVYLAHLSEENNQPDLAELTVSSVLQDIQSRFTEQVRFHRTSRAAATDLHALATV